MPPQPDGRVVYSQFSVCCGLVCKLTGFPYSLHSVNLLRAPELRRNSSTSFIVCTVIMPYHSLSLTLSLTGCLVRGCQTVCQPMASSLRGQSSRSSWGKPPPCRNSPFAYGCRARRGEREEGRESIERVRLNRYGYLKPIQACKSEHFYRQRLEFSFMFSVFCRCFSLCLIGCLQM